MTIYLKIHRFDLFSKIGRLSFYVIFALKIDLDLWPIAQKNLFFHEDQKPFIKISFFEKNNF